MSNHITVLGEDIDGVALRKARLSHPRHLRADGTADHYEIQEAVSESHKPWRGTWSIEAKAWERIFGNTLGVDG